MLTPDDAGRGVVIARDAVLAYSEGDLRGATFAFRRASHDELYWTSMALLEAIQILVDEFDDDPRDLLRAVAYRIDESAALAAVSVIVQQRGSKPHLT